MDELMYRQVVRRMDRTVPVRLEVHGIEGRRVRPVRIKTGNADRPTREQLAAIQLLVRTRPPAVGPRRTADDRQRPTSADHRHEGPAAEPSRRLSAGIGELTAEELKDGTRTASAASPSICDDCV